MNKTIFKDIVTFVLLFGITTFIAIQVITMDRYKLVALFFLISSIILGWFYRDVLKKLTNNFSLRTFLLLSISVVSHFLISYFIINYLDKPNWSFDDRGTSWLLMSSYFIFAIPLNILMQQTLVAGLTMRLIKEKLTLSKIRSLFVVGFGFVHIFQILRLDIFIGILFTIGAIVLSFIFPFMIVNKKDGYAYNYIFHLLVYDLAALLAHTIY